ncbi:major facilitator superfamily domain-containing protein, partial [Fennellomyces sp. T-0311]
VDHEYDPDEKDDYRDEINTLSPPDGGYGWLVTLAVFLASLLEGGLPYCCIGVMQDYYEREVFGKSSNTTVQLSAAGTLVTAMVYLFSYPTTIIYNTLGARLALAIGSLVASGGLIAAGAATEIWHLYISMSLFGGIGISILFNVGLRVLPFWFDKRSSTAFGIIGSSQPFAGLVVPFVMTHINNSLDASWTFRILGLVFLAINAVACLLIKETPTGIRCRKKARSSKTTNHPRTFLNANVILWIIQGPIQMGGLYIPYTFLPSYATHIGLSDIQGSAAISLICGANFLGRIGIGLSADRLGRLNALILTCTLSGLSCFLIWIPAYNFASLVVFSIIYGLFSGGFGSTCPSITSFLVGMDDYPTVISLLNTLCALGSLASTVASGIESISSAEPFLPCKLMTGCACMFSASIALVLKLRIDRNIFSKI